MREQRAVAAQDRRDAVGVVVNPERAGDADDLVERLDVAGMRAVVRRPADPDALTGAAAELRDLGVGCVAAVGGDGTQRAVASALAGSRTALATVPAGTVNLLGRVLGVRDLDDAVSAIAAGRRRTIDLGRMRADGETRHTFVLNASTGWDAAVIDRVGDGHKRFGRLGYALAGVRQWLVERPRRVTVALDGQPWFSGEALTVLVLNVGNRGSTSLDLAPGSTCDDGRLDVLVVRRHSPVALLRTLAAILRGRPPRPDCAVRGAAERIEVRWDEEVASQVDGDELAPGRSFDYEVAPSALDVVEREGGAAR